MVLKGFIRSPDGQYFFYFRLSVQYDGRVLRTVCELPGGDGGDLFAGGRAVLSSAAVSQARSFKFQLKQLNDWFSDRQRYQDRRTTRSDILTKHFVDLLSAFSLKAFSTESLDDGMAGSINSLRRPSCTKTRILATTTSAAKRTPDSPKK